MKFNTIGQHFSMQKKWFEIFQCKFFCSQLTNLENFCGYQIENFLNFSKLTQLLSLGQFLRPLEAFKTKVQDLLTGAVLVNCDWSATLVLFYFWHKLKWMLIKLEARKNLIFIAIRLADSNRSPMSQNLVRVSCLSVSVTNSYIRCFNSK